MAAVAVVVSLVMDVVVVLRWSGGSSSRRLSKGEIRHRENYHSKHHSEKVLSRSTQLFCTGRVQAVQACLLVVR